ncbi:sorting nexin 1 [Saccharomyces paradoxus]|uniref:Sorting nexin 1 n=1 Tax=Saccharomyces paradoxus TaxID=27291 RepID=A0A8B8UZR6_SACPA|nr:Vps5 [Saccharomyces paradoxus]QHS76179.1 Vps5 [Saccharomyces paradoxus]
MDYEDNLEAPVWDELNHEEDKTQSVISNSIEPVSQLSTHEKGKEEGRKDELETTASLVNKISLDIAPEWKGTGLSVADNPLLEEHDDSKADALINSLAPEQDPIADLTNSATQLIVTRESGDALFTGNVNSPLVFDDTIYDASTSPNTSRSISGRRFGKPRILFDSAKAQRNSKRNHSLKTKKTTASNNTTKTPFTDPLKKAEKENEFVEEPLDDRNDRKESNKEKAAASVEKNILEQVDKPLYNLPKTGANTVSPIKVEENPKMFEKTKTGSKVLPTEKATAFKVEVKDPVKVGELTSIHVEYTVISESALLELKYAQVSRRYRDFRWLYRQLQSNHWGKIIPPPPEKQSVGSFKEDFIENRRFQMESMLKKIGQDPVLQKDRDFLLFLTSDDFGSESKRTAFLTGSGAINDSNDLSEIRISEIQLLGAEDAAEVLRNGGIDAESHKGFMNISFSSLPKYNETEEFFTEKKQKMDELEDNLKKLSKSLDMVDTSRNSLAASTEEFSSMIGSLSSLNISEANSELLNNFADVHKSIRSSLERSSLQETLTMGVMLDDYIRSLASVKAIFNQRAKLGYFLVVIENDMNKKHTQLGKLGQNIHSEKFKETKKEFLALERRYNLTKTQWQEVGDRIKDEFQNFSIDKIREFRNGMEISLEAAIESQKECIELWETFYQTNL